MCNFVHIMKRLYIIIIFCISYFASIAQDKSDDVDSSSISEHETQNGDSSESYAWIMIDPLGLRERSSIDTLMLNYYHKSIPSGLSSAYATTGNFGAEGMNLIYFERTPMSDFFFSDAQSAWLPNSSTMKFYNTRIPMTLLSYNTSVGKETAQDWLKADFSGNINRRAQVGGMVDYIYSKGNYNYQALKDLVWGVSGSYIGDRYEMQSYFYHYDLLNKENGGIIDDRYITDPAAVQGGTTKVDTKTIPTNLSTAHSRLIGTNFALNNRYKVGYWDKEVVEDSVINRTYIPVTSFVWTLNYKDNSHMFRSEASGENKNFFENTYLNNSVTIDNTSYWSLTNTIGVSLLEGFNKYAKMGLSAFATHQVRKYTLMEDPINRDSINEMTTLTPLPGGMVRVPTGKLENLLWVGGQLTKQQGALLKYNVTAKFGLIGPSLGDVDVNGDISTKFKLFGDSVAISAYGWFKNETAPYLMENYVSNHFIWQNDFSKVQNYRFGGKLDIPHTRTFINVGLENITNYIYFNEKCLPTQYDGNVQVFSASLSQNIKLGIFNWDNKITYQTSSNSSVIPLPNFAIYSNLYLLFKVAKVLDVQLGVDCDYYTKYKSVAYQPATMSFYNQNEIEIGNYPFMNAYVNMKLSKARFYLMASHINQGWFSDNYFSMPHYPLNPLKFQLGVSVDFAN